MQRWPWATESRSRSFSCRPPVPPGGHCLSRDPFHHPIRIGFAPSKRAAWPQESFSGQPGTLGCCLPNGHVHHGVPNVQEHRGVPNVQVHHGVPNMQVDRGVLNRQVHRGVPNGQVHHGVLNGQVHLGVQLPMPPEPLLPLRLMVPAGDPLVRSPAGPRTRSPSREGASWTADTLPGAAHFAGRRDASGP